VERRDVGKWIGHGRAEGSTTAASAAGYRGYTRRRSPSWRTALGVGGTVCLDQANARSPRRGGERRRLETINDGRTTISTSMGCSALLQHMLKLRSPLVGNPLTGEPYAGNPPVRFGGRGDANHVLPTPINKTILRGVTGPSIVLVAWSEYKVGSTEGHDGWCGRGNDTRREVLAILACSSGGL